MPTTGPKCQPAACVVWPVVQYVGTADRIGMRCFFLLVVLILDDDDDVLRAKNKKGHFRQTKTI